MRQTDNEKFSISQKIGETKEGIAFSIEAPIQGLPVSPRTVSFVSGATLAFTNMPAALTELASVGRDRRTTSLGQYAEWRLHVGIGSASSVAGAKLGVQYSVNAGTNWAGLDNGTDATISTVTQLVDGTVGSSTSNVTAWAAIYSAARVTDVLLRIVGSGGDGVADPNFSQIHVEFR